MKKNEAGKGTRNESLEAALSRMSTSVAELRVSNLFPDEKGTSTHMGTCSAWKAAREGREE